MDINEPLMTVSVGQKRKLAEAIETLEESNDGDQKKSKNSGELSFHIPTMAKASAHPHQAQ